MFCGLCAGEQRQLRPLAPPLVCWARLHGRTLPRLCPQVWSRAPKNGGVRCRLLLFGAGRFIEAAPADVGVSQGFDRYFACTRRARGAIPGRCTTRRQTVVFDRGHSSAFFFAGAVTGRLCSGGRSGGCSGRRSCTDLFTRRFVPAAAEANGLGCPITHLFTKPAQGRLFDNPQVGPGTSQDLHTEKVPLSAGAPPPPPVSTVPAGDYPLSFIVFGENG
jgi:hypothetical protein